MDEWIDGSLNHQKCMSVHYTENKSSTLCHKWTAASIKRGRARPRGEPEMTADIWSMMSGAPMGTTLPACTHWLIMVHTLMSFLPLHLLLLAVFLQAVSETSRHAQKDPHCVVFLAAVYFPLFRLKWSRVMMLCNILRRPLQLFGRSLQKPKPFYAQRAQQTAAATLERLCSEEDQPNCFPRETRRFPLCLKQ